jgi:hypothetical protein
MDPNCLRLLCRVIWHDTKKMVNEYSTNTCNSLIEIPAKHLFLASFICFFTKQSWPFGYCGFCTWIIYILYEIGKVSYINKSYQLVFCITAYTTWNYSWLSLLWCWILNLAYQEAYYPQHLSLKDLILQGFEGDKDATWCTVFSNRRGAISSVKIHRNCLIPLLFGNFHYPENSKELCTILCYDEMNRLYSWKSTIKKDLELYCLIQQSLLLSCRYHSIDCHGYLGYLYRQLTKEDIEQILFYRNIGFGL